MRINFPQAVSVQAGELNETIELVLFAGNFRRTFARMLNNDHTFGFRVHIVSQQQSALYANIPLPLMKRLSLSTGQGTLMRLRQTQVRALPWPYSSCQEQQIGLMPDFARARVAYTQWDCMGWCRQLAVISECHCYSPYLIYLGGSDVIPACKNSTQRDCLVRRSYEAQCDANQCPLECESAPSYDVHFSFDIYPNPSMEYAWLKEHWVIRKHFTEEELTYENVRQSVAHVRFSFADIEYTVVEEVASKTLVELLADMGGTLGLFVGASLLTFVEFVELALEMLFIFRSK
mgnify:CR=1 FL=1